MEMIGLTKRSASTVAEIANLVLEQIPMTFSATDIFPGRKIFFPIPTKRRPKDTVDFLYVYAQSKLAGPPKDPIAGFTDEDVVDEVGIYLFKKTGNFVSGCTYTLKEFLEEVITDLSLQNRLIYRVNEMRQMVHLDESFLDLANSDWQTKKKDPAFMRLN